MIDAPLHLEPRLVSKPWGGRGLERFGREVPPATRIGESWEVADLAPPAAEDLNTPVALGPSRGATLSELIADDPDELLGEASAVDGRFPLLVKLLDAEQPLSVQVHPPPEYAREVPGTSAKSESWVILSAPPSAHLYIGLKATATPQALQDATGSARLLELLRRVPAVPGEVHHIPAGVVHALGGGVIVAEVQTPSDTTFRLYDWSDRFEREPRPLHSAEAMRCIELAWADNLRPPQPHGRFSTELGGNDHYRLVRHHLGNGSTNGGDDRRRSVTVLQVLEGELAGDGFARPLGPGDSVVLPAAWQGRLDAVPSATVLEAIPLPW